LYSFKAGLPDLPFSLGRFGFLDAAVPDPRAVTKIMLGFR
jgi:hypothetical protein